MLRLFPPTIGAFIRAKLGPRIRYVPRLRVDPVLSQIIGQKPQFTYEGDYQKFKANFDAYKYQSIGFPENEHRRFDVSSNIGDIDVVSEKARRDLRISGIEFGVVGGRLPGLLVQRSGRSEGKVVIIVPGHPSVRNPLDDLLNGWTYQKGIALRLAKNGYTVFAVGLRGFNTSTLTSVDFQAIASMKLYSWLGFVTSDALLLREHIVAKYGYPRKGIGFIGQSSGGAVSMFAGALDEDVPFAIVSGFFGSFSHSFMNERHSRSGNIAGILKYFEMRDFLIAMAPRPIVVTAGEHDTFAADHAQSEFSKVQAAYARLGQPGNARIFVSKGLGHEYDVDLVLSVVADLQREHGG